MKVLKKGKSNIIKCDICKSKILCKRKDIKFQPTNDKRKIYEATVYEHYYIICPVCNEKIYIRFAKNDKIFYKTEEPPVIDIG